MTARPRKMLATSLKLLLLQQLCGTFAWHIPTRIPLHNDLSSSVHGARSLNFPQHYGHDRNKVAQPRKRFALSHLRAQLTSEEEQLGFDEREIIVSARPVTEDKDSWQPWTEVELKARTGEWVGDWKERDVTAQPKRERARAMKEEDMPLISEMFLKEGGLEAYQNDDHSGVSEEWEAPTAARAKEANVFIPPIKVTTKRAPPFVPPSATPKQLPSALAEDGFSAARWLSGRRKGTALVKGESRAPIGTKPFLEYNAEAIEHFYDRNPIPVISRMLGAGVPLINFALRVATDKALGRYKQMEEQRARELRDVLSASGPTAIKVGQALSNRPDLVSPLYMNQLQQLQDNVGAFDHQEAIAIVERELGASIEEVFDRFSPEPIASASLGQVYRARIRGMKEGQEVAVKVQRPGLASLLPVDMYILRRIAAVGRKQLKLRSDLVSIVDEFAERLFEEINYNTEANNALRFKQLYGDIDRLVVPDVYRDFSGRRVLTMEWIEGTKPPSLDHRGDSSSFSAAERGEASAMREDWQELINVGVQCNLKQLLDDGFFHADPHSGNLLRTTDGSLAYLDFGMMSSISATRRYQLIASIVHLINRDYDLLARDFQVLGFLPESFSDFDAMSAELKKAFGNASGGEKLANINFMRLADNLAAIAFRFPFRIPAYYSLIIRSLTILEGIALASNPNFKIVDAAYPYVARRLLFGSSPELQDALREIVLEPETGRLKWSRLLGLLGSQEKKSAAASSSAQKKSSGLSQEPRAVDEEVLKGVVEFLLAESGRPYVDALIEDVIETADNIQLTAGVFASVASGGILPPPVDKPSLSRLQTFTQILGAVSRAAGTSIQQALLSPGGFNANGASLEERVSQFTRSIGIGDRETEQLALRETQRILQVVTVRLAELSARRALRTTTTSLLNLLEGSGRNRPSSSPASSASASHTPHPYETRLALRRQRRARAAAAAVQSDASS